MKEVASIDVVVVHGEEVGGLLDYLVILEYRAGAVVWRKGR